MRIAVCAPQVPFVRGGAELMAEDLVDALRARDHEAELVTMPFKWYPGSRVLDQAFLWRLARPDRVGRAADRPRDRDEVPRLLRPPPEQGRLGAASVPAGLRLRRDRARPVLRQPRGSCDRRAIERLDGVALGEARRVFATSRNVADRLQRFNGIEAELLPHPPQSLPYRTAEPEGFVLSVNRLDRAKRIDMLIEAAQGRSTLRVVITGEGPDRDRLEGLASGLNGQVEFTGRVDDERLADLYARSLAVYYAPVDEDFGMVPYEAFLSSKPVVTTADAGARSRWCTTGRQGSSSRLTQQRSPARART